MNSMCCKKQGLSSKLDETRQLITEYQHLKRKTQAAKPKTLFDFLEHPRLFILFYIIPVEIASVHGHIDTGR